MRSSTTPLQLEFNEVPALPRLAWAIAVHRENALISAWHGRDIVAREQFFVEGAWDGPLDEGDFDRSGHLMGSGCRIRQDGLYIVAPCHTLEAVWLVRGDDRITASNSLPFLLERAGLELDPAFTGYKPILDAANLGLDRAIQELPTKGGTPVTLYKFKTLRVNTDLNIDVLEKPESTGWQSFEEYRDYMVTTIRGIVENAQGPGRPTRYEPLASISSGYDSSAVAALASDAGCRRGITFAQGHELYVHYEKDDDSGEVIGRHLGMEMTVIRGNHSSDHVWPEFAACGDARDERFGLMEEHLDSKLFFSGMNGDHMWGLKKDNPNMVRAPYGVGGSLAEFRLRVGFIHAPAPCFGGTRQPDVRAIGLSPEMEPYRIGGDYDRPVARRILEEKGVPREAFGYRKRVACSPVPMGESLRSFMLQHRRPEDRFKHHLHRRLMRASRAVVKMACFGMRHFGIGRKLANRAYDWISDFRVQDRYKVAWGVSILLDRYREAMRDGGGRR